MASEKQILNLTTAIVNLIIATKDILTNEQSVSTDLNITIKQEDAESEATETKVEKAPRKPRKSKEVAPLVNADGKANITAEEATTLAKKKIAESEDGPTLRATIKAKVSELGGDSIASLTQDNLNSFYDYLNDLDATKAEDDL